MIYPNVKPKIQVCFYHQELGNLVTCQNYKEEIFTYPNVDVNRHINHEFHKNNDRMNLQNNEMWLVDSY